MNNGQWTADSEQRTTDNGQRTADNGQLAKSFLFLTVGCTVEQTPFRAGVRFTGQWTMDSEQFMSVPDIG